MKKIKQCLINYYICAFLIGLIISFCMISPFIIRGNGIFTLIDDFNYQQIPFNMISNSSIKNGDIYWNWYTDLGSNFIGAYSFYTLGSPFFWLSLLLPATVFPYLIGPLLILKYSVACVTAYAYIQRFVKYKPYALVGAALYTFSGFQMVNLMFNHFHDVTALFPLLLIGLEELIEKKRFVLYTLSVGLMSTVSFFFFEGQIIYLIIYFCVRFLSYDFRKYVKFVPLCLAGGILGMALSGIVLVPSILFTLQNPRVGNSFFYGTNALFYDRDRYLLLLKAFLMPAEVPQQISAIIKYNFMSCEFYLPLVGSVLAVLFMVKKKSWVSRLLKVSIAVMLVPILNSLFSAFNTIPYFRWMYMPILILALASAKVLDQDLFHDKKKTRIVFGMYSVVLILFAAYLRFWPWSPQQQGYIYDSYMYKKVVFVAITGVAATFVILQMKHRRQIFMMFMAAISVYSIVLGWQHIKKTQNFYADQHPDVYTENFLEYANGVELPDDDNYRIHIDKTISGNIPEYLTSNMALILEVPSVESYHSNISPSIYEFYESLGVTRMDNVATIIPDEYYGIFDILSVKYTLTLDEEGNVKIVENDNFLPMGLVYEYYIPRSEFMALDEEIRHQILLKAVVIEDEITEQIRMRLEKLPNEALEQLSAADYADDISKLQENEAQSFEKDSKGFSAHIMSEDKTYAYFTVPYDSGWKATVNGEPTEIFKANGFMLVAMEQGNNEIRFEYNVPGLKAGVLCTVGAAALIGCILLINRKKETEGKT